MTNLHLSHRFQSAPYLLSAALTGVLSLAVASPLLAQTLRLSNAPLRLGAPSASSVDTSPAAQRSADYIVVIVNSEPVTNNEVRSSLLRAEQQLTQSGGAMPPRPELTRLVLERMITDKAQLQEARQSGIRIDEVSVDGAVLGVAQQNQMTVDELRKRMVAEGLTFPKFRETLRDELLVNRFKQREVDARVKITDSDIDQFLREQEGSNDMASIDLNLAQILVAVPETATPDQVAAFQAKAQQAAERARAGTDFAQLVNEFSELSTRAAGGQMGLRNAERYPTLFLDAVKSLRTGGIAGPIRSGAGFHVLKVIEKRQAGTPGIDITQTRARHILLRVSPQLNQAAALQKLAELRKRVVDGQDFAVLAKENSDDGSASSGGDLGWANPGMFVPEFEQVMNSLAPGQLSQPLVSRFGVHLIQVMERRAAALSTREQRELARSALREKKQEEAYALWAQEVRGRAYVEYRDPPF
jgi:peptidyl-prolyl cis-trans isomerase SurA